MALSRSPKVAVGTLGLLAAVFFAASATAVASPVVLPPPAIPGVAPVPGAIAKVAQPSPNMGILSVTPDQGVVGTPMTISGSGLPARTSVELTWSTANVTWVLDPQPGTVNYLGRQRDQVRGRTRHRHHGRQGRVHRPPEGASGLGRGTRHLRGHRQPGG